jgi:ABC-type multidrug transport system fused ATPase/permease subunit
VVFDHVDFAYTDDVKVLDDINLHVEAGETIAIVGPTGAGKSTLTALVARFYDVTAGRVMIDGTDIREVERTSLARRLGIVLQDPFLFSGTVRENIRYGRLEATEDEIEGAARTVGAHEFIRRLPQGYDTMLHERGQNRRWAAGAISFAGRSLSPDTDPDEATANVDARTEMVIKGIDDCEERTSL